MREMKLEKLLIKLTIICLPFINFQLFSLAGAGIKLMHVVFVLFILFSLGKIKFTFKNTSIFIFFIAFPTFQLIYINDFSEWIKTYVIYVMLMFFLCFLFKKYCLCFRTYKKELIKFFLNIMLITHILGIIQFGLMNAFGLFFLKDVFGPFQYSPNQFDSMFGLYRAYSVFIEPSFFGWTINLSIATLLFVNKGLISPKQRLVRFFIAAFALLCTLSTTAIVFFILLLFIHLFTCHDLRKYRLPVIVTILVLFIILWRFTNLLAPLTRISSIAVVGSSGYERIVAPLNYVKAVMNTYPLLGRGLGQEGNVDFIGTIGKFSGVHNALIGIIVNFGLSSLVFYIFFIAKAVKKIAINKNALVMVFAIVAMYASTGSYISFDSFFFSIVMFAIIEAICVPKHAVRIVRVARVKRNGKFYIIKKIYVPRKAVHA